MKNFFKYRPEIDGLRAIAVLPVIFFHAGFKVFNGGFVGVDIFFVISGYLITSLILSDIENHRFSLKNFYERRARRILPALFCVMFLSIPIAWIFLLPSDLQSFGNSLFAASTFWSNFLFFNQLGYFDTNSELKPFLHTWSLSIEEQFYIIYPIIFLLFFNPKKKTFIYSLFFFGILSIFLAQWAGNLKLHYPYIEKEILFFNQAAWTNFFLPTGRIWELIIGALVAFYLKKNNQPKKFNHSITLIGLALIFYSVFAFSEETSYPSFYTLLPTFGTALLILFVTPKTLVYKILSKKIFVLFGLISYSAYLYHYPIFAFFKYQSFSKNSTSLMLCLVILVFILSFFSWKFIEKPFRNKKIISKKKFFFILLISYIVLFFLVVINNLGQGFQKRFDTKFKNNYSINFNINDLKNKATTYKNLLRKNNQFSAEIDKTKVLIIGNSVAIDLLMSFDQNKNLFENYEFKEYYIKLSNFIENTGEEKREVQNFIKSDLFKNADVILVSSLYTEYETKLKNNHPIYLLNNLSKKYKKLLVVTGINPVFYEPNGIDPVLSIFLKHKNTELNKKKINEYLFQRMNKKFLRAGNKIKTMSENLGLIYLSKYDYTCNFENKSCLALSDHGEILYFDGIHYTKPGAKYFGQIMHQINWLKPLDDKLDLK